MRINSITLFLLVLFSCKGLNNQRLIVGDWLLVSPKNVIHYPKITFNDNGEAVFLSRADTVYNYKYTINDNQVELVDFFKKKFYCSIIKLNKDTLILKNMPVDSSVHIFIRKE